VRYLITGGAGFIGSHLAERLLEKGEQVVLLDNLSTGSMENIRHLKGSERLEYHLDGIENRQILAELVDDADVIVHLAAAVGVKLIVESPVRTIETNVNGTQMILEAAAKKKKLVLIASTYPFTRMRTWCWAPPQRDAGAMPLPKPSTNFSRSPIGKKKSSP
jgi:UDP-glucose 4-epimerase